MRSPAEAESIVVTSDDSVPGVCLLRLNRPGRRNAMSKDLVERTMRWLEQAAHDPAIRAVIIHGEGRGFCAGSDLAELAAMDDAGRSAFEADSGRLARMLVGFPRPVIAAVHGFAIGGGLTLAAACDIVITAPDAKWSLPEVPIGLFPAWGLEALSQRVGKAKARRLSWGVDQLDGREAVMIGLADDRADPVLPAALALAGRLAELPLDQAAAVKRYFLEAHDMEGGDRKANALFMRACASDKAQASFSSFGRDHRITD